MKKQSNEVSIKLPYKKPTKKETKGNVIVFRPLKSIEELKEEQKEIEDIIKSHTQPRRRKSKKSKEQKQKIRKRDNNTCKLCTTMNADNIHHIIPNGKASMFNLISLCDECHITIHKILSIDRKWKSVAKFKFGWR